LAAAGAALGPQGASPLLARAQQAEAEVLYYGLQDWAGASERASNAIQTYAALGDDFGKVRAQFLRAEAEIELAVKPRTPAPAAGAPSTAEAFAKVRKELQALADFHARRDEPYYEAMALNNIGVAYHMEGRYDDALRAYRRTVPLYEQLGETPGQAAVLQNISLVEFELGRLSDSVPHYAQVLDLLARDDDPTLYASILCNSALANWASGHYDTALRQLGEALPIMRAAGDKYWEAHILNNTGVVYDALGDRERALDFYRQALALRTVELDPRGRVSSLRTIANILRDQGKPDQALQMHEEALALASGSARKRVLVQIGRDLLALGRRDEAVQRVQAAIDVREPGDDVVRARALVVRGQARASINDFANAQADFSAALRTFRTYEQAEDELDTWVQTARAMRAHGASDDALAALDKALALAEEVRTQSANPELRATLLQPLRPAFDLKISLLAERYFANAAHPDERTARLALSTAERARARALEDFERLDLSAPGVPPQLAARRQAIYRELASRRFRLTATVDRAGTEDARVRTIRADIATLRQELDQIDAQIGAASATAARAKDTRAKTAAPLEMRAPAGVAMVEYWLGADEAFAWLVDGDHVTLSRLGASAAISNAARAFHTALHNFGVTPAKERLELGTRLYDLALRPLGARVLESRTLIFVPDGALHYVPFAALRVGTPARAQFLVENHDVAVTPSIGMFLRARSQAPKAAPTREMLLVADPVYTLSDARLASLSGNAQAVPKKTSASLFSLFRGADDEGELQRLPGTAREAATIAGLLPKGSVDRLEGFAANRDRFLNAGLERYRFIHIASHAVSDADIPQASALILSRFDARAQPIDGNVLAADFVPLQLNARAVVLSACDTDIGKDIAGEGLVGLRYVVLARGAQAVISSLWPVSDQATAQMMSAFYPPLLRGEAHVEAAFSAAMRTMIAGSLRDPSLWSAFALTVSGSTGD
jgi:CHAT domain-containing protein